MANQTVGTAPVQLNVTVDQSPVIQNLGPGNLYIDANSAVSTTSGFKLAVGDVYEFARDLQQAKGILYAVADAANTDVRLLVVG